jgi:hypothetical protein
LATKSAGKMFRIETHNPAKHSCAGVMSIITCAKQYLPL